jgi:hypothetical protein
MTECLFCGSRNTQKCHVKDKASFEDGDHHDFHNIILLCPNCHYDYFDQGRMAIGPSCETLIVLRCVKYRRVEFKQVNYSVYVNTDFIAWKNTRAHSFLKAELRKLQAASKC